MLLLIECIVICLIFTLILIPSILRNPINYIMSYPKAIRIRIESLPRYKSIINYKKKRHILIKFLAVILIALILAIVSYFSNARTFIDVFKHVAILFVALNVYDLIILDICWFCHSKRVRIPGTEDMIDEYSKPYHHIVGALKGLVIGLIIAILSALIVQLTLFIM